MSLMLLPSKGSADLVTWSNGRAHPRTCRVHLFHHAVELELDEFARRRLSRGSRLTWGGRTRSDQQDDGGIAKGTHVVLLWWWIEYLMPAPLVRHGQVERARLDDVELFEKYRNTAAE